MAYIKLYSSISGRIGLSIRSLVEGLGFRPDAHKDRINDNVIKALYWLKEREYIYFDAELWNKQKVKINDCFQIQINTDPKNDIFNFSDIYVALTETEFNSIIQSVKESKKEYSQRRMIYDPSDLLNVFLNIKKYINFNKNSTPICFPSHRILCRDCNISSTSTMNKFINRLTNIGILYTYKAGKYIDSYNNIKYTNNFYALQKGILTPELCDGIVSGYYASQVATVTKYK